MWRRRWKRKLYRAELPSQAPRISFRDPFLNVGAAKTPFPDQAEGPDLARVDPPQHRAAVAVQAANDLSERHNLAPVAQARTSGYCALPALPDSGTRFH